MTRQTRATKTLSPTQNYRLSLFFFLGGLSSHVTALDVAEHDDVDSRSSSSALLCFRFSDDDFSHAVKDIFKTVNGCFSIENEMCHGGGGGGGGQLGRSAAREATLAEQQTTTVTYYDVRCCHYSVVYLFFAVISRGPQGTLRQIFNASLRV